MGTGVALLLALVVYRPDSWGAQLVWSGSAALVGLAVALLCLLLGVRRAAVSTGPEHTYRLAVHEGEWGISVDLTAAFGGEPGRGSARHMAVDVSAVRPRVPASDVAELELGVRIMCAVLGGPPQYGTIFVGALDLRLPDYQDGVIAWAVVGWLAEELGVQPPPVAVYKGDELNRYVFDPPLERLAAGVA